MQLKLLSLMSTFFLLLQNSKTRQSPYHLESNVVQVTHSRFDGSLKEKI
jgi:hypothetical protein